MSYVKEPHVITAIKDGVFTVAELAGVPPGHIYDVTQPDVITAIKEGVFTAAELTGMNANQLHNVTKSDVITAIKVGVFTVAELTGIGVNQLREITASNVLLPQIERAVHAIKLLETKELESKVQAIFDALREKTPIELIVEIAIMSVPLQFIKPNEATQIAWDKLKQLDQDVLTIDVSSLLSASSINPNGIFNSGLTNLNHQDQHGHQESKSHDSH